MLPTRHRILSIHAAGLLACPDSTEAVGQDCFKPHGRVTR
jgi:hypothetical protein